MLSKRLIVCLDVRDRKVTKGVKFEGNVDIGDPVEMAAQYYADGVDELVFYDITASAEGRPIDSGMVGGVAKTILSRFAGGGGTRGREARGRALRAGAEKVGVNSLAVQTPEIIDEGARAFGSQCVVLGMDAIHRGVSAELPSGYEIVIQGGGRPPGGGRSAWAGGAVARGAGEICLNGSDADGTREG